MRTLEQLELVRVGPGTPSGDVFRRYWLPVEVSANLGGGGGNNYPSALNPIRVKMLGENLLLFRDSKGKPHLLEEHCAHRGTSLYYGRVEGDNIRCMYHGWLYDGTGNVVEMPGEPPESRFPEKVKQPAYPCIDIGGLIFTYMGPPALMPVFPMYHQLFAENGVRVLGNGGYTEHCNVFQAMHDNNLDPWHAEIAHGWFRSPSVQGTMHWATDDEPATPVKFSRTPWGTRMQIVKLRGEKPNAYQYHETHTVWPTQRCNFQGARSMKWAVPVDDIHTRWITADFYPFGADGKITAAAQRAVNDMNNPMPNIGHAHNLPDDWAQQVGGWWNYGHPWRQGNVWEDEVAQQTQSVCHICNSPHLKDNFPNFDRFHLATSDEGFLLNRKVWEEQMIRVKEGMDPIGILRDASVKTAQDAVKAGKEMIRITSDDIDGLTWEESMRLFNMEIEDRVEMVASQSGR
jgi:phenylpropionate dioxygenase-like ring-hydroxylating dioxygenase large terminal subunit